MTDPKLQAVLNGDEPTPKKDVYHRPTPISFDVDSCISEVVDDEGKCDGRFKSKIDWTLLRAEYINDRSLTMRALAQRHGCSEQSIRLKAAKEGWVLDRNKVHQEFVKVATQENLRRQARSAISFNASAVAASSKLLRLVNIRLDQAEAGMAMESKEMGDLARINKAALEAGRLALGLSTDNKEVTGKDGAPLGADGKSVEDLHAELIKLVGEDAYNLMMADQERKEASQDALPAPSLDGKAE